MFIFFVALASCLVLILLLRKFAHRFGLVDHPSGRKQHRYPTPTVGGVAMFLGVTLVDCNN